MNEVLLYNFIVAPFPAPVRLLRLEHRRVPLALLGFDGAQQVGHGAEAPAPHDRAQGQQLSEK